jgi:hypothetical protein
VKSLDTLSAQLGQLIKTRCSSLAIARPTRAELDRTMTFAPGDEVHVAALGKGVVREVRNGGRYLVELKGRSIVAAEAQLSAVSPQKRPASSDALASNSSASDSATRSIPPAAPRRRPRSTRCSRSASPAMPTTAAEPLAWRHFCFFFAYE